MHQFFDHFLKNAPAPEWMTQGIPYLERDEEKLHFRQEGMRSESSNPNFRNGGTTSVSSVPNAIP